MGIPSKAKELNIAFRKGDRLVFQEETSEVTYTMKCLNLTPDLLSPAG